MKRLIPGVLALLFSAQVLAQTNISSPGSRAFGNRIWQGDVTDFAHLPTGTIPGEKHMTLDTRTLWVWTCTVSGMTQTCDWESGTVGTKGDKGDPGDAGISGANGNTVRSGTGAPSSGTGVNGDFYVDTASLTIYGPKAVGAWGSGTALTGTPGRPGAPGSNGSNGATWTTGSGVPSGGADGDLYLRSTGDVYQRASGSWGIVANLIGPPGVTGDVGPAGPTPSGAAGLVLKTPTGGGASSLAPLAAVDFGAGVVPNAAIADITGCSSTQFVTGFASGVFSCGAPPLVPARVFLLDSALPVELPAYNAYKTVETVFAAVSAGTPGVLNPSTIVVRPGAPGSGADLSNYQIAGNVTMPIQTTMQGFSIGGLGASQSLNSLPAIKFSCPSGSCLKMTGGDSLADLYLQYKGAPTATGTLLEFNNTGSGSSQGMNLWNVVISIAPTTSTFAFDGITNSVGQVYLGYTAISMSGNVASRAVVSTDTVSGRGITALNSRFTGQTNCAKLIENSAASGGIIQLLSSRIDKKCTCDLSTAGAPFTTYATAYWTTCGAGTVTMYGPTYVDGGAAPLPSTCSSRAQYFLNTAGAEQLCTCAAAGNAWACSPPPVTQAAHPPYACSVATRTFTYYDTDDAEFCDCKGASPAWVSRSTGSCS